MVANLRDAKGQGGLVKDLVEAVCQLQGLKVDTGLVGTLVKAIG